MSALENGDDAATDPETATGFMPLESIFSFCDAPEFRLGGKALEKLSSYKNCILVSEDFGNPPLGIKIPPLKTSAMTNKKT